MFERERRRRAEQAGLRIGEELDRHFVHAALEAALGDEAVAKAGARKMVGKAKG